MFIIRRLIALTVSVLLPVLGDTAVGGFLRYGAFTDKVCFEPLAAEELEVTPGDRARARSWYEENILFAGQNGKAPAYTLSVNGAKLGDTLSRWEFTAGEESEEGAVRRGGRTSVITAVNESAGLELTVEATYYDAFATCEWTMSVRNTGQKRSGIISGLYAAKCRLPLRKADVYLSRGSADDAADFTMYKTKSPSRGVNIACAEGRSTAEYLPYFNLSGADGGAVAGLGWSGLWSADIRSCGKGTDIVLGQKRLAGYLEPGESVRAPLASLTFYSGSNPVKGFNVFRSWILGSVLPENAPRLQNNLDVLFVSSVRTAAEILYDLDNYDRDRLSHIDNLWMDAGWFSDGSDGEDDWSDQVGNWKAHESRFPNGIREISDYAARYGVGLVLWYEPERLAKGSLLDSVGSKHDGWTVSVRDSDDLMWNLGNDDARAYLSEFIAASLTENGVSVYRQDFNFDPAPYWRKADRKLYSCRAGFAENHYITGLYAFLDYLLENVPGLTMDNCAAGGRRLDLEMTRRGVPMWRSDYNCDQTKPDLHDATQAHTYGISFWLPVSGTFLNFEDDYAARSCIMPILQVPMSADKAALTAYSKERADQLKNYFPIACGGTDKKAVTAMQYGDEKEGCVLIYQHEDAEISEFRFKFSGLDKDAVYTVTDADSPASAVTATGAALMNEDHAQKLTGARHAYILRYKRK